MKVKVPDIPSPKATGYVCWQSSPAHARCTLPKSHPGPHLWELVARIKSLEAERDAWRDGYLSSDAAHEIARLRKWSEKLADRTEQAESTLAAQRAAEAGKLREEFIAALLAARVTLLEGAAHADEERLIAAAATAGIPYMGCDTADHLAVTVGALKTALRQIAALNYGAVNGRYDHQVIAQRALGAPTGGEGG